MATSYQFKRLFDVADNATHAREWHRSASPAGLPALARESVSKCNDWIPLDFGLPAFAKTARATRGRRRLLH